MKEVLTIMKFKVIFAIQGYNDGLPHVQANGSVLNFILQMVIGITAALSVLFVVIGGMRYVFSDGDPESVGKAKSTIIYAVVGLALSVVAEAIVSFVLNNSTLKSL